MINQIFEIVNAINEAGINISWIQWDGSHLGINTNNQEKTIEILNALAAFPYMIQQINTPTVVDPPTTNEINT